MNRKRISTALVISAGYFLLVMLVLASYESSLQRPRGGMAEGLLLVFITMPTVFYTAGFSELIGCAQASTCEHIVGIVPAAAVNAVIIYAVARVFGYLIRNNLGDAANDIRQLIRSRTRRRD
jgi:hypothetical protein